VWTQHGGAPSWDGDVTGPLLRRLLLPLPAVGLVVVALTTGTSTDAAAPADEPAPAVSTPPLEDPFSSGPQG
jgi:hypothetical protein